MMPRQPSEAELRRGEAATWGSRHETAPAKMRVVSWKPLVKNLLHGFATIELLPIGEKIDDFPVLVGANGAWATLPSKPVLDRDGRHAKPDGKAQYSAFAEWKSRELADRFSQAVVAPLRTEYPDVLNDGGGS